jgi:membrane protein
MLRFIKNRYILVLIRLFRGTIAKFAQHNCQLMAAGMSFFGIMSLIPLMLMGVSTLGYVIGSSEKAQQFMTVVLMNNFPASADEILKVIYNIITSPDRNIINGIGLLGLMWSGMRFFNILQRALNSIWTGATQRRFFRARAVAFFIFLSAGAFFWLSFGFNWLLTAIRELNTQAIINFDISKFWTFVEIIVPFIATFIMLFFVYVIIPNAKVSLKAALTGSVFSALFIEIFKRLFNFVMIKFNAYGLVYGPLAGIIIFISWLYISMQILLFGAELTSQCQQMFFSRINANKKTNPRDIVK